MPRRPKDQDAILSICKQWISDKKCPYTIRLFCLMVWAVAAHVVDVKLVLPGTPYEPKKPPVPEEKTENRASKDVTEFLRELNRGGASGVSDSNSD